MSIWKKKCLVELQTSASETGENKLSRTLGPIQLMMIGIGAIIGAGLFSITGIAAAQNAGPAILISFAIAAIGCLFCGLCYSELATLVPVSGSSYTYAYATMGELIAWAIGWTLVLEYAIGASAVAISWSAYVVSLLQDFNIVLPPHFTASPWQPIKMANGDLIYGWINLPAILILGVITLILIRGLNQSARFNAVIVTIKVSVVILFIGVGIWYIHPSNYTPFIPANTGEFGSFGWSGIMRAAAIVFFAYIGFDTVSTMAQECKKPTRDLSIGILGSLFVCTVLYILFAFVMTGLVNYKDLNVAAPVALAIDQTPHYWLNYLIKLAILAGFTSVILVLLLGQSRIFYAMSIDGLLPKCFSALHPSYRTPWVSNLVLMAFVCAISGFAPLDVVAEMTSIGTLLAFGIVCAVVLILRKTHPEFPRPFKVPFVPLIPLAGIASCLILMASLSLDSWMRLVIWLAIGAVIYFTYSRYHSVERRKG